MTLPPELQALRDAASTASRFVQDRIGKRGEYYRILVRDPQGQIRYCSGVIPVEKLGPVNIVLSAVGSSVRGWRCSLLLYRYSFRVKPVTVQAALPFVSKSRSSNSRAVMSFSIPGNGIRQSIRSARRYVSRSRKVPRGSGTSKKSKAVRPNPEVLVTTDFMTYVSNGEVLRRDTVTTEIYRREWTGVVTPGFRSMALRDLPVNPHHVYIKQVADGGYFEEFDRIYSPMWTSGAYGPYASRVGTSSTGPSPSGCLHLAEAERKAIGKLIDDSGSAINSNLMQDLAQIGPTARTIGDAATRIALALKAVKAKAFRSAINILWTGSGLTPKWGKLTLRTGQSTADNWLALQYGWKPLIQDVHEAMNSLAMFYQRQQYITRRLNVSATVRKHQWGLNRLQNDPSTPECGSWSEETKSTCRYVVDFSVDDRLVAFLSQTGFTNPINLIWEVLPYSFVVDWFLPIGPYLESLTAFQGLTFKKGCKTQFTRTGNFYSSSYSGISYNGDPAYKQALGGGCSITQLRLDRSQVNSWPRLEAPVLKNPASLVHAANGLALLRGVFRGRGA